MANWTTFSQRDPRWSGETLGTGPLTLGQAGCLVTAAASLLCDVVGVQTDPRRLNAWLTCNAGYVDGDLFVFAALEGLGAAFDHFEYCELYAAPIGEVAQALVAGRGVLARVDFSPGGSVQQHWVRILDVIGDPEKPGADCLIMDPWQLPGSEVIKLLDKYGAPGWDAARAIFTLATYSQASGRVFRLSRQHGPSQPAVCLIQESDADPDAMPSG